MEGTRGIILGAALLAACQASPAPAPVPPPPSASAATSALAASATSAPVDQSVAKPLSERGAHELAADVAHRESQSPILAARYNPTFPCITPKPVPLDGDLLSDEGGM